MKAKATRKPVRPARSVGKKGGEAMVKFTPTRNLPLTIDGRTIEVHAGTPAEIPATYKALYDSAS